MRDLFEELQAVAAKTEEVMKRHSDSFYRDPVLSPHLDYVAPVFDAFSYSLFAGGKRLRPFLVTQFCTLCGGEAQDALSYAAAIEMIHTFSLIHDDLPCMDNDDLRRGKPTNHKVYGEATALLAGDALSLYAFETLLDNALSDAQNLAAVRTVAASAGIRGMIAGQQIDMSAEKMPADESVLVLLQKKKTGALFEAACVLGCIAADRFRDENLLDRARAFAAHFGLAFQITDDILDVTGDTALLGKTVGSDARDGKTTFVSLLGVDGAGQRAKDEVDRAKQALAGFPGEKKLLCTLCDYLLTRRN